MNQFKFFKIQDPHLFQSIFIHVKIFDRAYPNMNQKTTTHTYFDITLKIQFKKLKKKNNFYNILSE